MKYEKLLTPRRQPQQERSIQRAQQILEVTARLLDRVGFNDLTTILIAKETGISVGTLYHYFPNKHAILRAIAQNWLNHWDKTLLEINAHPLHEMEIDEVVDILTETFALVYREQKGILHLVQAMFAIPELQDLDERHDEIIISSITNIFKLIGINKSKTKRENIARAYLEMTHALVLVVSQQKGARAKQTLADTKAMASCLLKCHLNTGN